MKLPELILGLLLLCGSSRAGNILAVVPIRSRSHFIVIEPVLKGLASNGHNVTVVNIFPQKSPVKNYHDIDVTAAGSPMLNSLTVDFILSEMRDNHRCFPFVWRFGYEMCESVFKENRVRELIDTEQKFDLVITEIFSSDCFVAFAHKMKAPLVSIVTSSALPWMNARMANPDNPSYIVNYAHRFDSHMTFFERVQNSFTLVLSNLGYQYLSDVPTHEIAKKYFGDDLPSFSEIYKKTSLILVNSHFTINQVRPLLPNVIEVGGIHMKKPQPLSKDLQTLLDNATEGVVLFSLGSLIRSTTFPSHVKNAFISAFEKIPQLVLWKYEGTIENLPPNVVLRNWIPQSDILGHKNIRLLITHGGLASTIEAAHYGVPVIGIPMFADQPGNVMNLVNRGAGIYIDYFEITTETVYKGLQSVLKNPSYKENARALSAVFNDRNRTPLEEAIYWIEYVVRHKGAPHLRSAAIELAWFQLYLLDVIAFVTAVTFSTVFIIFKSVKAVLRRVSKKKVADKRKKQKTN